MEERTCKKIKKSLYFEKSGERFSVEIGLENLSPEIGDETLISFLKILFENVIKDLQCQ